MLHGFEAQGSQRASPLQSQLGISFPPCSLLGDTSHVAELGSSDAAFARIARGRGISPQQVRLVWELATAPVVVPIPGRLIRQPSATSPQRPI